MSRIVLRIDFDSERYLGHGRIELMELIGEYGSISKAAKAMGMSYKRAWYLAESINATFSKPVIERKHGGTGGGSAKLSTFGQNLVRDYRDMERQAVKVFAKKLRAMEKHISSKRPAVRI